MKVAESPDASRVLIAVTQLNDIPGDFFPPTADRPISGDVSFYNLTDNPGPKAVNLGISAKPDVIIWAAPDLAADRDVTVAAYAGGFPNPERVFSFNPTTGQVIQRFPVACTNCIDGVTPTVRHQTGVLFTQH